MWRALWCCMLKGLWAGQVWMAIACVIFWFSSRVSSSSANMRWIREVLVDSYCSSWSRFWCVFVLLCLQQMQECSSSAQMNHRVESWFLFVILIDWIMKLWISYQPGTCDLRLDNIYSVPIQFIWFAQYNLALGSSDLYSLWFSRN